MSSPTEPWHLQEMGRTYLGGPREMAARERVKLPDSYDMGTGTNTVAYVRLDGTEGEVTFLHDDMLEWQNQRSFQLFGTDPLRPTEAVRVSPRWRTDKGKDGPNFKEAE